MIAKISPLLRLPSTADTFDYFVPPDLKGQIKLGQLVSIPWRSQEVTGVVLGIEKEVPPSPRGGRGGVREETFRARPVHKIIDPTPILTPAQLALIKKFSAYYFCPPGAVARLIVPSSPGGGRPVRRSLGEGGGGAREKTNQPVKITIDKSQLPLLTQAANLLEVPSSPRGGSPPAGEAGGGAREQTHHIVIQDFSSFVWLIFYLLKRTPPPIPSSERRGFKSSLVLLFPTIDILERFHAILIQQYDNITIIHGQLSKGAYWRAYQKILKGQAKIILSTRQGVFLPIPKNSQIIFWNAASPDFKQYDQHPRYDARTVAEWIASITNSHLIFISPSPTLTPARLATRSVAGGLPSPSKGEGTLIYFPLASSQKTSITLVDMKSQPNFSPVSEQAIDAITESINAKKKAVVIGIKNEDKIKSALTKSLKNVKDVIIASPSWLQGDEAYSLRKQIGCLIIYSIEPLLALPDYRSSERAYHRLQEWKLWAQELLIPKIILQSYSPDNLAVRAFALSSPPARGLSRVSPREGDTGGVGEGGELKKFIASELTSRRSLEYPPFVDLIKVAYKGQDKAELERVLVQLKSSGVKVLGPYQEYKTKRQSFLLKIKNGDDIPILRALSSSLWVVDRDPENVL